MPNRNVEIPGGGIAALSRIGQRRQVVIPKKIFDAMRPKEGDFMEVTAERGRVSMKPKRLVDWDKAPTAGEAKLIRHGLKQAKEGKTRPWSRIKHKVGM
jgi:AbrB family looped-hinge helix DNA binding protein